MAKYYHYRQNNSGGSFTGPAINVYIEADTPEEADAIAIQNGLYFDGEGDCSCCGDRWYSTSEHNAEDNPDTEPSDWQKKMSIADNVPAVLIIKKELVNG